MPKIPDFHSANPHDPYEKKVYHNNSTCQEGRAIDPKYKTAGTASRPLCDICAKANREGK